jgi:hypothetical protein
MKPHFYEIDTAFLEKELQVVKQYALAIKNYDVYGSVGRLSTAAEKISNSISLAEPRPQFFKLLDSTLSLAIINKVGVSPDLVYSNKRLGGTIMFNKPFFRILPHIDKESENHRKSCLTFPLYPDVEHFAPTIFYDDKQKEIYRYTYKQNTAVILNTRIMHGVVNNQFKRISLQLAYNLEPNILYEKIMQHVSRS